MMELSVPETTTMVMVRSMTILLTMKLFLDQKRMLKNLMNSLLKKLRGDLKFF